MVTIPENLSAEPVFAGVDWGGTSHQLCIVDAAGQVLLQRRVQHNVPGLAELDELLASRPNIKVAIERGEGLLVEHLQQHGLPVYCISPKISARARERYRMAAAKSDAFDAFVLADTLRHEHAHWRPLSTPLPLTAELAAVTRDRERIIESQRAVESQLRAILEAHHPAPLHLFSTLDRDITLSFITDYPTPVRATRVGEARMQAFCRRHGYSGRVPAAELVERLRPHLLSASSGTTAGKQFTARLFVDQLRLLNTQIRACDQRVDQLLTVHPDAAIFRSFPGIGPVTAAVLISEMGDDRTRYPHPAALLAETGLAPVTRASGRMHQVHFRYASRADWAAMAKDLKPVYTAPTEAAALDRFAEFSGKWERKYPAIIRLWTDAWAEFVPFLAFDVEIRKVICTTNAIESINARLRRAVNARGHFPTEQAALKCLYMALMSLDPTGRGRGKWVVRWKAALNAFDIHFDGRLSAGRI